MPRPQLMVYSIRSALPILLSSLALISCAPYTKPLCNDSDLGLSTSDLIWFLFVLFLPAFYAAHSKVLRPLYQSVYRLLSFPLSPALIPPQCTMWFSSPALSTSQAWADHDWPSSWGAVSPVTWFWPSIWPEISLVSCFAANFFLFLKDFQVLMSNASIFFQHVLRNYESYYDESVFARWFPQRMNENEWLMSA